MYSNQIKCVDLVTAEQARKEPRASGTVDHKVFLLNHNQKKLNLNELIKKLVRVEFYELVPTNNGLGHLPRWGCTED